MVSAFIAQQNVTSKMTSADLRIFVILFLICLCLCQSQQRYVTYTMRSVELYVHIFKVRVVRITRKEKDGLSSSTHNA